MAVGVGDAVAAEAVTDGVDVRVGVLVTVGVTVGVIRQAGGVTVFLWQSPTGV